jgi:RNA polymerase sigma factor (sigma-70 family)
MDEQYIKRVTEGDTEAFRFLVEKYQHKAFSVAFSIVRNQVEAEDVVQEAFIRAYRKLAGFRGDASFSTWLLKIVVNEGIKVHRKRKVETQYSESAKEVNEPEINNSIGKLKDEEQRKFINIAMGNMAVREALVLKLFYIEELSLKQMEEVLDLKADHIKVLLFRARKQFYNNLKNELKHEIKSIV